MSEPWIFPPVDGFTADDLDRLWWLPRHTELIDGRLVFRDSTVRFPTLALYLLESGLRRNASVRARVHREAFLACRPASTTTGSR